MVILGYRFSLTYQPKNQTFLYINYCLIYYLIFLALQVARLSINLQNRPRLQDHKASQRPDHLGQIKATANGMLVLAHLVVTGQKKVTLATKNRKWRFPRRRPHLAVTGILFFQLLFCLFTLSYLFSSQRETSLVA